MWSQKTSMPPPHGVVPKEPTRLPPLADRGDGESDEASKRRIRRGANDMASVSRKRRDMALANREKVSPMPITLPGTLLKSPPALSAPLPRQSPTVEAEMAEPGEEEDGEVTRAKNAVLEGQREIQRLQEELRLRCAETEEYRRNFKKKSEEYEGCVVLLDVAQAELRFCQERMRAQSPTPPLLKPKRLKGVGLYASEREVAEEVAAWSVSLTVTRVLRVLQGQKAQEEAELQAAARLQAGSLQTAQAELQAAGRLQSGGLQTAQDELQAAGHLQSGSLQSVERVERQGIEAGRMSPLKYGLPAIQEHLSEPTSPESPSYVAKTRGTAAERWQTDKDHAAGTNWGGNMDQDSWHKGFGEFIPADEDWDAEVSRIATEKSSAVTTTFVRTAAMSPVPETGGTPTPGIEEPAERSMATQTSPMGEAPEASHASEFARLRKALITAQEDNRVLKLVVANSKKEIDEYNQELAERSIAVHASSMGEAPEASEASQASEAAKLGKALKAAQEENRLLKLVVANSKKEIAELNEEPAERSMATQTSPMGEAPEASHASEFARLRKALITAQEDNRVLKLVVANSKKEIDEYNQELAERSIAVHASSMGEAPEASEASQASEAAKLGKALKAAQEENRLLKLVVANSKKEIAELNEEPDERSMATQTSPTGEAPEVSEASEVAKPGKALITAQEENRVLKLVVSNSKKEIAYYNQVLMEKNSEHQQELQELQEAMLQERKRCLEDMKQWKSHVKKELGRDPVLSVCLFMWEREVTGLRTSYAFRQWRRKANQLIKARGMQGKMNLLVELHWVLRDWRVAVMELRAERMKTKLQQKWFHSVEQATYAWGRDMDQGLKHFAFVGWAWQKKFARWERKTSKNVKFTLRRWFYHMDTAVRYFAFLAWYEALMEEKVHKFQFQLLGKKTAFLKAVMAFEQEMSSLSIRAIFRAWLWATTTIQGTPFSKPDRPEDLAPARLVQTSRFNLAFCLSAWDHALTGAVMSGWHHAARHAYFQRSWVRYFRPQDDLRPILHAWRFQVQRAIQAAKTSIKVEKKEQDTTWFVSLLCFVYWRMKLKPSRAVTSYVPRLARMQAVAVQKLAEAEEHSVFLVIFYAWQMYMLLTEEEKAHDTDDEELEASSARKGNGIACLVSKAVKKQNAKRKEDEEQASKAAQAEVQKKKAEEAEAKVAALEEEKKALEEKHAEEKAKVEKLEAEAKKGCCSKCCIVQ